MSTVKYLHDLGIDDIHYEAMTIQEDTLIHELHKRGYYRTPWLWSILEILRQVTPYAKPFISPFRYIADVKEVPHNCDRCSPQVTDLILNQYCSHFDLKKLEPVECSCKDQWLEELSRKEPLSIEERVLKITSELLSQAPRLPIH